MNNAIKILYGEHEIIASAVSVVGSMKNIIENSPKEYEEDVRKLLEFLRGFADDFHHHKEEVVLFPEMMKKKEFLVDGIIEEMMSHHEEFRDLIDEIESNLDKQNYNEAQKKLEMYVSKLLDHIAIENEELFVTAQSLFNERELEDMNFRFQDIDNEYGKSKKISLVEMMELIREDFE